MAANRSLILGIDFGTTTVKVVVTDSVTDKIVGSWSRETKASVPSAAGPLGSEQDIEKIFIALDSCMSMIRTEVAKCIGRIGVSGQMHGIVMWRRNDQSLPTAWSSNLRNSFSAVSHLYTWQDGRCSSEFLASLPKPNSHLRVASGFGCATLFWLVRHEPGSLERFSCAGTVHDFFVTVLCGLDRPVMSVQNAASWGYFNTATSSWNFNELSATDFPVRLLPEVVDAGRPAGKTICDWYGIPCGTPVTAAMGDLHCYILSTLRSENDAVVNVGTSAQFTYIMSPDFDPAKFAFDVSSPVEYVPYFDGRYLAEAASLNGGNVLAAFVSMLVQWHSQLGGVISEAEVWSKLDELLLEEESVMPVDPVLTVEPTLLGERHLPDRLGVRVDSATASNTSLSCVYRCLSRSLIENLRAMSPPDSALGHIERIIGTGGALARNSVMQAAVRVMYGKPLVLDSVDSGRADSAVGAAIAAARYLQS